ncbi:hypothetical protein BX070DRAFT_137172 [Coemansia spiralis]|nr:hypothetical protein BX070DRAFT_137172 [Coemansia spiralis]
MMHPPNSRSHVTIPPSFFFLTVRALLIAKSRFVLFRFFAHFRLGFALLTEDGKKANATLHTAGFLNVARRKSRKQATPKGRACHRCRYNPSLLLLGFYTICIFQLPHCFFLPSLFLGSLLVFLRQIALL